MEFSVVILTQPNSPRVSNAIRSALRWSDDVVVVYDADIVPEDFMSEWQNVRFVAHKLMSFAEQRNIGVSACRYEWILHVDSDEEVTDSLGGFLKSFVSRVHRAYEVPRRTYLWSQPVKHAFGKEYHVRLHRREIVWVGVVHEVLDVPLNQVGRIVHGLFLEHYTVDSLDQWIIKTSKYVQQEARHVTGVRHRVHGPLRPVYRVVKVYIFNGGFLDGGIGIVVALLTFIYETLAIIAVWEQKKL